MIAEDVVEFNVEAGVDEKEPLAPVIVHDPAPIVSTELLVHDTVVKAKPFKFAVPLPMLKLVSAFKADPSRTDPPIEELPTIDTPP